MSGQHACTLSTDVDGQHMLAYSAANTVEPIRLSTATLSSASCDGFRASLTLSYGGVPAFTLSTLAIDAASASAGAKEAAHESLRFINTVRMAVLKGAAETAARLSTAVKFHEAKLSYFWSPSDDKWPVHADITSGEERVSEMLASGNCVAVLQRGQIFPVLKQRGDWALIAVRKAATKTQRILNVRADETCGWIKCTNSDGVRILHSVHSAKSFIKVAAVLRKKRAKNITLGGKTASGGRGGATGQRTLLSQWQDRLCYLEVKRNQVSIDEETGVTKFIDGTIKMR